MRKKLVSISLLLWNSRQYLPDCIASVQAQTYPAIELLISDNASTDGSPQYVQTQFPDLCLIENESNLGFARAHNRAIQMTDGEFYLPLNPDAILAPTFVAEMVKTACSSDAIGSVSGKVFFCGPNGPTDRLYSTGHLLPKNRKSANRGYKRRDVGQYDQPSPIFGPNGACPLYKRTMLEDVQMDGQYFDENFFLYAEDYDLCWRAQWLGWRSMYTPSAVAYHYSRGTGGFDSPLVQYQFARNHYMTILKNDHFPHFLQDLPYVVLWELIWQTHTLLTNPRRTLAHLRAYWGFVRAVPQVMRQRRALYARRRVTPRYMRSLFSGMVLR